MKGATTHSDEQTIALGAAFAEELRPGDVVALFGDLGTGKTRFVLGACRRLGTAGPVTSPTFTLVNEYDGSTGKIAHVDLYRIGSRAQLAELGLEEYFDGSAICFVEWADMAQDLLPAVHYEVHLAHGADATERKVTIRKTGPASAGGRSGEARP
jgi:tRNA threonylcarbamoyladenosine biosynthesis protein TsaE